MHPPSSMFPYANMQKKNLKMFPLTFNHTLRRRQLLGLITRHFDYVFFFFFVTLNVIFLTFFLIKIEGKRAADFYKVSNLAAAVSSSSRRGQQVHTESRLFFFWISLRSITTPNNLVVVVVFLIYIIIMEQDSRRRQKSVSEYNNFHRKK